MTSYLVDYAVPSSINLQMNLCSASALTDAIPAGHHPITCRFGELRLEEDGRFACDHGAVGPGDPRTQACVDHSIAVLLFELLREREGPDVPG